MDRGAAYPYFGAIALHLLGHAVWVSTGSLPGAVLPTAMTCHLLVIPATVAVELKHCRNPCGVHNMVVKGSKVVISATASTTWAATATRKTTRAFAATLHRD
jgi:hypothetical protein